MVHALERIHRWLKPDGRLIDVHPTPEPAHLEVCASAASSASPASSGEAVPTLAGDLEDTSSERGPRRRHALADGAIADAIARGWFFLEEQKEFAFRRHADGLAEMREYVDAKWNDACLEQATLDRATTLLSAEGAAKLWLREQVVISRLRPL